MWIFKEICWETKDKSLDVQTKSRILSSLYLFRTLIYPPENQEGLSVALWLYTDKVWSRSNEKRQRNQLLRILLFYLLVTLTFTVRSWKWIGLLYFLVTIHKPCFKQIGSETMEILKLKASEKERKKIIKIKNFTKISYWITLELSRHTDTLKNNLPVNFQRDLLRNKRLIIGCTNRK